MSPAMMPPVLLVPGWSDTPRQLAHAARFLQDAGWPSTHVERLAFRDRYGCNIEHASEIASAIARLRERTGADRIGVVAHSMGGLGLRRHLLDAGGSQVRIAIFAGTPHRGTRAAHFAWGRGGPQMRPGSEFLRSLERPLPAETRAICLRTPFDLRIIPGSSAFLQGTECVTVRALRHQWLLRHRPTLQLIADLLRA